MKRYNASSCGSSPLESMQDSNGPSGLELDAPPKQPKFVYGLDPYVEPPLRRTKLTPYPRHKEKPVGFNGPKVLLTTTAVAVICGISLGVGIAPGATILIGLAVVGLVQSTVEVG